MRIRAVFIGKSDKNYKQGMTYTLDFDNMTHPFGSAKEVISIQKASDFEGKSNVLYSRLKRFLDNWTVKS